MENALYVVATPIGNLEDITLRALNVLKAADFIICEDTRVSLKLLNCYEIKDKKMITYNDHSDEKTREKILNLLIQKKTLALISDAGTPLISDPGHKLINFLRKFNQKIIPVPGASALTSAISVSGIACDNFLFLGFLPTTKIARNNLIKSLPKNFSFVFFESANRIEESLKSVSENLGQRRVCAAREITKLYEEIITDDIEQVQKRFLDNSEKLRGEFVIIVEKAKKDDQNIGKDDLQNEVLAALSRGESVKDLSQNLSEIFGIHKKEIYKLAIELTK
jgi:16S rRNA (cytidine1402-2'-O)-methyltransferase